jgi:2-dehydro-3-deoxy-D-gluconate 5-dehydrogenase
LTGDRPLAGQVALVSGSSGGLGFAAAQTLADRGAAVAITEVSERRGIADDSVRRLRDGGADAIGIDLDVRDPGSIASCVAQCCARWGSLDILVNNAGVNIRKPALDLTPEDWDAVLNVNIRGAFFLAQAAAGVMAPRGSGKIINVASMFGLVGGVDRAAYATSKAGLIGLTRCLALEWARFGIQVNAIAPSFAETPLTEALLADSAVRTEILGRTPAGRLAQVGEIARTIAFLATPGTDIITGTTVAVDGGWTAQ